MKDKTMTHDPENLPTVPPRAGSPDLEHGDGNGNGKRRDCSAENGNSVANRAVAKRLAEPTSRTDGGQGAV